MCDGPLHILNRIDNVDPQILLLSDIFCQSKIVFEERVSISTKIVTTVWYYLPRNLYGISKELETIIYSVLPLAR